MTHIIYSGKRLPSQVENNFQELFLKATRKQVKAFPYTARITRSQPTAFVFLLDQSGSMGDLVEVQGKRLSKAEFLSTTINQLLNEIIDRCKKGTEIRDYFHICLIGYGGDSENTAKILWQGNLSNKTFVTPTELIHNYLDTETIEVESRRPNGTIQKIPKKIYRWIAPQASHRTPMRDAFLLARDILVQWVSQYSQSYPPMVINISDGAATDTTREELLQVAQEIQSLATEDGNALIFNIQVSDKTQEAIYFPCKKEELPQDEWVHLLFDMSSDLPENYNQSIAQFTGRDLMGSYTALVVNAPLSKLISLLNIGTNTQTLVAKAE
ncbi:MAG: hypothetical protein NZ516_04510 [Raineya sp.]|nr:hypothetical protein [Raineya sp.]